MDSDTTAPNPFEEMLLNYQRLKGPTRFEIKIDLGETPNAPETWKLTIEGGLDASSIVLLPGDQVKWELDDDGPAPSFTIEFTSESPFEFGRTLVVPGGESKAYAVGRDARIPYTQVDRHKYTITVDGYGTLDPDVVVGGPGNKGR